ncbi:hypothetical protein PFDG_05168 [Plasmodium falciparum Dd2]|uniref:Uncharacterized protein n=1 Tax=Plasmodium falciparum (isolate Dd2) TaxID=57267 RepID=A0A0L7MAI6_PLAF4|nr:hypothetical protein PFDG_05168 [Plasmodium falciparum Dd2]
MVTKFAQFLKRKKESQNKDTHTKKNYLNKNIKNKELDYLNSSMNITPINYKQLDTCQFTNLYKRKY